LFDLTSDHRSRAEDLLKKLPEATFLSARMVKDRLERVIKQAPSPA